MPITIHPRLDSEVVALYIDYTQPREDAASAYACYFPV